MATLSGVLGLVVLFVGTHIGLATRPVRSRLVAACGEWGFLAIFFAVAATSFGVLTRFYAAHQWEGPPGPALGTSPPLRAVLMGCVVTGVALMVGSLAGYSGSAYDVGPPGPMRPARGLERVTRHSFFTGVVLFGVAHALLATRLVGSIVMLALAVLAVAGAWHQDRKLVQRRGAPFMEYLASTSALPFAAIAAGRQRLVWRELPIGAMVAGLVVAAGLRYEHGAIFAHGGAWVILAVVGGAAQVTASAWRRDRRARPRSGGPPTGDAATDRRLAACRRSRDCASSGSSASTSRT